MEGGSDSNLLYGGAGNDTLLSYDVADAFFSPSDTLAGGTGNDIYELKGSWATQDDKIATIIENANEGTDLIKMNTGYFDDVTSYTMAANVENILLVRDAVEIAFANHELFAFDDPNLATIIGNDLNNTMTGTDWVDVLDGGAGNDVINGCEGHDTIDGGTGNDAISGGNGLNSLLGGTGSDEIFGGNDRDFLRGDDGNDKMYGGWDADYLVGGNGWDRMAGGDGNDTLEGGTGGDTLIGGLGANILSICRSPKPNPAF